MKRFLMPKLTFIGLNMKSPADSILDCEDRVETGIVLVVEDDLNQCKGAVDLR
jgi:hypothetical protein